MQCINHVLHTMQYVQHAFFLVSNNWCSLTNLHLSFFLLIFTGTLPKTMCIAWYSLDVLFTSSSIIHLCMISIDRYLSLQYPLKYGRVGKSGRCRTAFEIFIVWILSFCIAVPLFFSSVYADHGGPDRQFKGCGPENTSFVLSASITSFYAPLLIMIIMYLLTVRALQRQRRVQRSINANTFVKPDQKNHPLLDVRCRSNENSTTTLRLGFINRRFSYSKSFHSHICENMKNQFSLNMLRFS